ncbi:hypothetical protein EDB19DRAFT_1837306 [Suillus lakei]|nr:hypothetical protein EDB19DRAFT_1837306 [Suillus lakei]
MHDAQPLQGWGHSLSGAGSLSASGYGVPYPSATSSSRYITPSYGPDAGYQMPLWQVPSFLALVVPYFPSPTALNLPPPDIVSAAPYWTGNDNEFQLFFRPPLDLQHLQPMAMGEIPDLHVIHTTGPARTSDRCSHMTRHLPPMPRIAAPTLTMTTPRIATPTPMMTMTIMRRTARVMRAAGVPVEPNESMITPKTCSDVILLLKEHIVSIIFTANALASFTEEKKYVTQWMSEDMDILKIWCAVTAFCTAFAMLIHQAIMMGYSLFPPQGYCVQCLVIDNPLAFMHDYSFTPDGVLVIHAKFSNRFVFPILAQLIWCSTFQLHKSLEDSPHCQLHYAIGATGAITEAVLMEQGQLQLAKGRISPQSTYLTFTKILSGLDGLSAAEKAAIDSSKDHMILIS